MRASIGKVTLLAALLAWSAVLAAPSHAQIAEQGADVVVTGRLDPPTLSTEIRRFVRGHARLSRIDQLARWQDSICVRVMNLPAAFADFIANRVRTLAREAGASASEQADCAPNVSIMFTTEPQAVLNQVRADRPELLGAHFINQRNALATMSRPIQSWYMTATSNGLETAIDEPMRDPLTGRSGSRMTHGLRSLFVHVLILVDQNQVAGAEVGPISDYVAMLALTDVSTETWSCGGLVTIMELFSRCGDAPQQLTTPDRAFLQGLYTMDPEVILSLQRGHIAGEMRDALTGESAAPQ